MSDDSRFVTDPARLHMLLGERFVPWPSKANSASIRFGPIAFTVANWTDKPAYALGQCQRGFVSDSRFAGGTEAVIKRTDRSKQRRELRNARAPRA